MKGRKREGKGVQDERKLQMPGKWTFTEVFPSSVSNSMNRFNCETSLRAAGEKPRAAGIKRDPISTNAIIRSTNTLLIRRQLP